MFFINLYNILNSIDNTLEKTCNNYPDSLVDGFIDELKSYLNRADCLAKLEVLPKDTLFVLDRYEGDYAVCENNSTGEMFDIPRSRVTPYAKDGDVLKLDGDMYQVYTP